MATSSTTASTTASTKASTAATVAVVLLQPTKWAGKTRAPGGRISVSAAQAESLVQSGSARIAPTEPTEAADNAPVAASPFAGIVKPRRSTAKQAGPATAAD